MLGGLILLGLLGVGGYAIYKTTTKKTTPKEPAIFDPSKIGTPGMVIPQDEADTLAKLPEPWKSVVGTTLTSSKSRKFYNDLAAQLETTGHHDAAKIVRKYAEKLPSTSGVGGYNRGTDWFQTSRPQRLSNRRG